MSLARVSGVEIPELLKETDRQQSRKREEKCIKVGLAGYKKEGRGSVCIKGSKNQKNMQMKTTSTVYL